LLQFPRMVFLVIVSKIIFVDLIFYFSYWASWEFSFIVFLKKTLWITIVFPDMVFVFFNDFFQNYLCQFYFVNIELVENYNYSFSHKTLWIATVFSYMVYFFHFFLFWFFYDFFQNFLCWFYFFNIELVENLAL